MSDEKLNLIEKLSKIRSIAEVVTKDKKGYNYKYADITAILAKITAGMKKYGVSLIPSVLYDTANVTQNVVVNTKVDKTGKVFDNTSTEMLVSAGMVFTWINDDNPTDKIEVPWFIVGSQSDPSQAFGSGLTYCTRYFLCNYFQIAQPETDVDSYRTKQKVAAESEDKLIAEHIVKEIDLMVKQYIADNDDKKDDVKEFISRYAKNANYLNIKEPALASKLLNDFKQKFTKGE